MRILLLHNRYCIRGGEDVVFESETELLKRNGNDVDVIIFDNNEYDGILNKIWFFINSIFSVTSYRKLLKRIDSFAPDVIHIHNLFYSASPSIIYAAHKRKIPLVMTLHNFRLLCPGALFLKNGSPCEVCRKKVFPWPAIKFRCFKNSLFASLGLAILLFVHNLFRTWNVVNCYILLNEFQKQKFLDSALHISKAHVFVKPNHCDSFNVEPVTDHSCDLNTRYFLFAGRLSEEKGIRLLVDSWDNSPYTLFIAGDGNLLHYVQNKASFNNQIRYVGLKPRAELIGLMENAFAIIVPSICYEACPVTVIEAFCLGIPVIAAAVGSLKVMVIDEVNGLLYNNYKKYDLKEKVDRLISDHELYNKLKAGARKSYLNNYTPEISYKKILEIYGFHKAII